jgi:hypothetical protein
MPDPIVLFSSLEATGNGDALYNGGFKLQSLWIKLLRQHGIEAFRVTRDGTQLDWMIEHQPVMSLQRAHKIVQSRHPVRVMTTWIVAEQALRLAPRPYFYDAEIAHTMSGQHFITLKLWQPDLAKIATHSRTQQAWYMATFGFTPQLIQEWSASDYFTPDPDKREPGRVGFMFEGSQTDRQIIHIRNYCQRQGVPVTFYQVSGHEREVIDGMQKCDVFLGMNPGKHSLWGEGCPRAAQEAMHCGAVVIAYDVHGNREYLIDGYTGYLVKRNNPQAMAERLVAVMQNECERDAVRARGVDFMQQTFSGGDKKFEEIKEFLDL